MTDLADRRGQTERVYQPAEDSRLLADAVVESIVGDEFVLDVGTGSGYVGRRVADAGGTVVGSDVNPHACRRARATGLEAVRTHLTTGFRSSVFDVVCFNPPYLPTPPDDEADDWMERALSGGETGRAVVDPFLDDVGRVLDPEGVVFLLVSSLTGVDEVVEHAGRRGFVATVVAQESFPFERLSVVRLTPAA